MTTAVQRRRGTSTEHATFTGLDGEITVNTTTYTAHIHDGATVGGVPLAKADGSNIVTSSIDINGGTIDGTVIGGTTPAAVTTTALVATTADINAGTIDGTVIGGTSAAAGTFTTITASGEITANGGIALGDNDSATFGAGDDLQIYHDGSNSYIRDTGTGNLNISADQLQILNAGNSEIKAGFTTDGAVDLYYNNALKLATTATGIDVTGTVTADGLTLASEGDQIIIPTSNSGISGIITTGDTVYGNAFEFKNGNGIVLVSDTNDSGVSGTDATLIARGSSPTRTALFDANGDVSLFENTGTTAKLFWDASAESLGIGTTSLTAGFRGQFEGNSAAAAISVGVRNANTTGVSRFVLGNDIGQARFTIGYTGSTASSPFGASLGYIGTEGPEPCLLMTDGSERARLDASGNLLVGTTTAGGSDGVTIHNSGYVQAKKTSATTAYFDRLSTDGTIAEFRKDGTTVGSISVTGSSTAYNTSSDERLKENITDAPAGNIDAIKVRSFDWKADGSHQDYGMVAQELEAVAPYAVTKGETEDDMWSVDYSKLVPMLIKEIQDLKAEVAALKGA